MSNRVCVAITLTLFLLVLSNLFVLGQGGTGREPPPARKVTPAKTTPSKKITRPNTRSSSRNAKSSAEPLTAEARANQAKAYLVNDRGIAPFRIMTIDGGYREQAAVELWVVPSGAAPPAATPMTTAVADRQDITRILARFQHALYFPLAPQPGTSCTRIPIDHSGRANNSGNRCARLNRSYPRSVEFLTNQPPVTSSFAASSAAITLPCPNVGERSDYCTPSSSQQVQLATSGSDPDGDTMSYYYTVTGGRITGEGANVTWDLTGASLGTYTATVKVDDGCGCVAFQSTSVTVAPCTGCYHEESRRHACPTSINVDCPSGLIKEGTPVTFAANVSGGPGTQTYNWSASAGIITSGQGTNSISVDTAGLGGQSITATVELGGLDPSCSKIASCTAAVAATPVPRKFDEYGDITFEDEKARLDNFAVQLQNEPTARGYIIAYGGRRKKSE